MQIEICLDHIWLNNLVRGAIEQTERMNHSRIAAVHELKLEAPVEFAGLRRQRALEVKHQLIQHWFVRSIVKQAAEVLIIVRVLGIERNAAVDPAGDLEAGLRRFRLFRDIRFAGDGDCGQGKRK